MFYTVRQLNRLQREAPSVTMYLCVLSKPSVCGVLRCPRCSVSVTTACPVCGRRWDNEENGADQPLPLYVYTQTDEQDDSAMFASHTDFWILWQFEMNAPNQSYTPIYWWQADLDTIRAWSWSENLYALTCNTYLRSRKHWADALPFLFYCVQYCWHCLVSSAICQQLDADCPCWIIVVLGRDHSV